jgi:23S rRNA (cytosine1962-C5)-methyltransferase
MIRLTRKGVRRWLRGHPWIFRGDVASVPDTVRGGDLVPFAGPDGRALGVAAYSDQSDIAVRGTPIGLDEDAEAGWLRLLDAAIDRRADRPPCARLVNGDADGLPGLIVDRYGPGVSLQTLTQAADRRLDAIVARLDARLAPTTIALRNDGKVRQHEGLPEAKRVLRGDPEVEAPIGDLTLAFDLLQGQKTGGFLDQTDNRLAAARFLSGEVLDCFSYDGGFGLQLAAAGNDVTCVDSSEHALERLRANAARNGLAVRTEASNVFDLLRAWAAEGRQLDGVVLDPPAFAKSRKSADAGRRAYKEINLRAFKLLRPGGRLVTCTCSAHLDRADFERVVSEAAADAGRWARVVERRSAAPDHPTLLTARETDYLKVLLIEVS